MINELWSQFPKMITERINGLLEDAEPSAIKAFQLFKTCQYENLWTEDFEKFSSKLAIYFSLHRADRTKSILDNFLNRPLPLYLYPQFDLNFRNGIVSSYAIQNIANWAHNLMRVSTKSAPEIISKEVFITTINSLTHPGPTDKDKDLNFDDFCATWKKTIFNFFGKQYNYELDHIIQELRDFYKKNQEEELQQLERTEQFRPLIYLTQTEIDWTERVLESTIKDLEIPKFPLSKGPNKPRLIDLVRTIQLYRIVQNTQLIEFIQHKEKIKATIIDRCQSLLKDRAH